MSPFKFLRRGKGEKGGEDTPELVVETTHETPTTNTSGDQSSKVSGDETAIEAPHLEKSEEQVRSNTMPPSPLEAAAQKVSERERSVEEPVQATEETGLQASRPTENAGIKDAVDESVNSRISSKVDRAAPSLSKEIEGGESVTETAAEVLSPGIPAEVEVPSTDKVEDKREQQEPQPSPDDRLAKPVVKNHSIESIGKEGNQIKLALNMEKLSIGRALDSNLVIDRTFNNWQTVSRHHAEIYREGDQYVLEDRGASNGTYIDGLRTRKNILRDGVKIGFGKVEFLYKQSFIDIQKDIPHKLEVERSE